MLGRHVLRRAQEGAGLRAVVQRTLLGAELGDAEVEDLHASQRRDEDVVRFQVSVRDPQCVRRSQGAEHFEGDAREDVQGKGATLAEALRERRALQVLHGDVRAPVRQRGQIEHVDDALVTDDVHRACLGEEPLHRGGVAARRRREHLHRHATADARVHAEVHHAHAAPTEHSR